MGNIPIEENGLVTILVETPNYPLEGIVQVLIAQKYGGAQLLTTTNYLPGSTIQQATWQLITHNPMALGFSTLQARATVP